MSRWADYSGGRPSGAALKAAGFTGVIRYVGIGSSGKRITAAEYQDLTAAGLQVLLVAEQSTGDAWGGYNSGVTNATAALNDARALGVPDSVPIFAAADSHATTSQVAAAVQYARGFRDVLGKSRAGFYGFSETLNAVFSDGSVSFYWRCGSQPSATEQAWVNFWQRNAAPTTVTVSGVACDINEQYQPIAAAPTPTPTLISEEEDTVQLAAGNRSASISCKGKKELVISVAYDSLKVNQITFWGPYGKAGDNNFLGGAGPNTVTDHYPWVIELPANILSCSIWWELDNPQHEASAQFL